MGGPFAPVVLLGSLFVLLICGMPIAYALGIAALISAIFVGLPLEAVLLKENGELAYPVISWMDKRMNSPYEHIEAYGDVSYVTTTSGYLTHRLTGEFTDTCANYIGWWPMDDDTFDWSTDPALFQQCNVTRDMLFDVVKPGDVLGYITPTVADLTGVPAGLPVVATAHDKAVEALGAGTLEAGTALISLGTYIGAIVHGHENVKDAERLRDAGGILGVSSPVLLPE